MGDPASSPTAENYMQAYERTAITTALHPPKVWELFILFLNVRIWKTFPIISTIRFTMEEESNGQLAFLDTLLKWNNAEISVLVYRKPTHTDQYLYYSSHHQTSC